MNFVPGMRVARFIAYKATPDAFTVQIVHKNYLILNDGSKWDLLGHPRPRPSSQWGRVYIIPWTEEHTLKQEQTLLRESIDRALGMQVDLLSLEETLHWKTIFNTFTELILERTRERKREEDGKKT